MAQATSLAIEDHKKAMELAARYTEATIPPLALYASFYMDVLDELDRGAIKPARWLAIMKRNGELHDVVKEASDERDRRNREG